jgi:hypothetical protein
MWDLRFSWQWWWWCSGLWPCRPIGRYQCFEDTYCLHLQDWSPVLKMESVCFSETLVSTYKSTQRHDPEGQHCHAGNFLCGNFFSYCISVSKIYSKEITRIVHLLSNFILWSYLILLTTWNRVLLEKLTLAQLVNKFCHVWNPNVHYHVHKSPSLVHILG